MTRTPSPNCFKDAALRRSLKRQKQEQYIQRQQRLYEENQNGNQFIGDAQDRP